ncbi:hypothetical protein M3649_04375 [Ureibacillus chungkukjangi]|uniref:ParM/StbA family protein n=1 Tax=Ureibacillus chungkukjangi TaxID=1202712 RepID=UPI0020407F90|nr:hypothetical protein [Ureibacillus chungkukjangi]MCM3387370.1 hypothetical protein [Ureibacillus chungkukjangi]
MERKSVGIVSVDDGGFSTCIVTKDKMDKIPSVKGNYGKDRNLTTITGKHDFIIEYKDKVYCAGTLAQFDCELPIKWFGKSKAHIFFDLSVLLSCFLYGYIENYVAVSVPLGSHTPEEKKNRTERLVGSHTMTVNGVTKTFYISDVIVTPESASAYWINEPLQLTRWLDFGSRTSNFASTFNDGESVRYIDTQSGSFYKGIEQLGENFNSIDLVDYVCGRLFAKGWETEDTINILGGGALIPELVEAAISYFPRAQVMENPSMANAIGMYNLARYAFQMS